jgi:hypothetical protein
MNTYTANNIPGTAVWLNGGYWLGRGDTLIVVNGTGATGTRACEASRSLLFHLSLSLGSLEAKASTCRTGSQFGDRLLLISLCTPPALVRYLLLLACRPLVPDASVLIIAETRRAIPEWWPLDPER